MPFYFYFRAESCSTWLLCLAMPEETALEEHYLAKDAECYEGPQIHLFT